MGENKPVDSEAITYTRQLGKLRKIKWKDLKRKLIRVAKKWIGKQEIPY